MRIDSQQGKANLGPYGLLLVCLILVSLSSCNAFKVVRVPIPIPTFGLVGGGEEKVAAQTSPQKTVHASPSGKVYYGEASWYGKKFHRRKTASGERFNMYALTAAHPTLPFNTKVKVTNVKNGRTCVVRINDRGPFNNGRIIDVSLAAARKLGFEIDGITDVKVEVI